MQYGFWRGLFLLLVLAGALLATAGWLVWQDHQRFLQTPILSGAAQDFEIPRGQSFRGVADRLVDLQGGAPAQAWHWRWLGWRLDARIQAGEYRIEPGMGPLAVLGRFERGEVIQYRFRILEGWTLHDLRLALAVDPVLEQTLQGVPDEELLARIGGRDLRGRVAGESPPEGQFLPETYQFTRGMSDAQLLLRAHRALLEVLDAAWQGRTPDLPLASPHEALVLASIVEKETGLAEERGRVAGVFTRRLQRGMRLQTDPTVIYGLGPGFSGALTRKHLEADTPHNTYTRAGLPPTPIALPGRASIEAALHPAPGNELYFVARGGGEAGHVFSRTLEEHNRAVARYRQRMRGK